MRAPERTKAFAKSLRSEMSPPEVRLWVRLRSLRAQGVHFRRQHPVGRYVLDFYCAKAKLAVEVDGISHQMADRPIRDEVRDAWLIDQGVRLLRFAAAEVMSDVDAVANSIWLAAADAPPPSRR